MARGQNKTDEGDSAGFVGDDYGATDAILTWQCWTAMPERHAGLRRGASERLSDERYRA
jgi:hypothetical protein